MSQYDLIGLYDFLKHTPEQGLRKMLVDNKPMGDVHFNLLLKVIRNCNQDQFSSHIEKNDLPKLKMGPAEIKIKESFWSDCFKTFQARGLLSPAVASKPQAA